ncbi:MAG: protein kinase, partial [Acidobacteria bacterium]|nr:protein kinase [Acidobacteriota bacterium]
MTIATGTRLERYEILSPLGAGGMGEIYLAEDTRLKRSVALKLLPSDFSQNTDRLRRFEQEAHAIAALNHPNIAHIYEIGESDGTHFIAMEFVDGVTLYEKIHRDKAPLGKLLKYLVQTAEGLTKAHAAGIVHRDLKPDNIMIARDDYAKILDFGLAKLIEPQRPLSSEGDAGSEIATAILAQHSTPGMIMGTAGYMSPEQAQGRVREIDHRSDIFSFGCILFEAATGRKAFEGKDQIDSLHKIVHAPPPQIKDSNPNAPNDLQRIVRRCLAKEPDKRYQSIKDVAIELDELRQELKDKATLEYSVQPEASGSDEPASSSQQVKIDSAHQPAISTVQTEIPRSTSSAEYIAAKIKNHKLGFVALALLLLALVSLGYWFLNNRSTNTTLIGSIAVMPFINESGNADNEYLSDGMTESLISSLSQLPNLSVKARSSVFRYKGKDVNPQTVGNELSVQAVLNGRVTQRGDELTLSLELIDVQTENVIWSERYNRKQADLVSLQSEIARDVSSKLKTKLSGADEQRLAKSYTENAEAYQLYLRGRFYWNKRTAKDIEKAIGYFQQSVALDPNYTLAYAGLADAYSLLPIYGGAPSREALPKAREAALRALSLDSQLAEAHVSLGLVLNFYDYDFAGAEREFKAAIELNPNSATAHQFYGNLLSLLGRDRESSAAAELRRALEIEPLLLTSNRLYGVALIYARKYDEAIAQLKKTLELDAGFAPAHDSLATVYFAKGSYAESVEAFARSQELFGVPQNAVLARESFARGGWQGFLRAMTGESRPTNLTSYRAATFHGELGEKDKAFAELNKAYENREFFMI